MAEMSSWSIGVLVLAVLWLACAVAALRIAVRLTRQTERHMRHVHGDVHASVRPRHGSHERPPGAVRHWAALPKRLVLKAWHKTRTRGRRADTRRPAGRAARRG
ncbi:hypothetical protein AB0M46_45900 [Dactylosporangium sp. NPDC051485]|uniref:hypothetical protein n=1 Tax=Dactylosporangium sp. NPDC051485 TaxID=3154846 RepID=UPI00341FC3F1